ncbi:GNAT family N-acetyltransferase [Sodalinema gerasimenkoae]|uniref:GNAT family N-acetyltransferase n=1 Tax=Sodalinema gerasimenkoae TaxID=2862348 RepID=UPI001356D8A0|nr:GNAT family N-acetyltransferase [Sodalinema gerasimenkoae]
MGLDRDQPKLRPPEKLNSSHDVQSFNSGNRQLDDWLKRRALKNEVGGASRTYVVCDGEIVIAYYCLANGAVLRTLQAAEIAGIRAILVHAISDDAKRFYETCGFTASPVDPMTLMVKVSDAHASLGSQA